MQEILNSLAELENTLKHRGSKNILLVTSEHSAERSGIDTLLRRYNVTRLKTHPNPDIRRIKKAARLYRQHTIDTVIAVGGGSAIDTAKAARLLVDAEEAPETIINNQLPIADPATLFIAIPTTAGSGAEATHFAVVYIDQQKYSLAHPKATPDIVVLDPELTDSLPPHITAASGMDAIAQAIEAYWSVKSTEASRAHSKAALEKLLPAIEQAVHDPTPAARAAMLQGAHYAGQAIDIAQTTGPHALSYGFTAQWNIDHGEAVSFTLPYFLLFNGHVTTDSCQDTRGVDFVKARLDEIVSLLGATSVDDASQTLDRLAISVGLRRSLPVDEPAATIKSLMQSVGAERLANNPRKVTPADMHLILTKVVTR